MPCGCSTLSARLSGRERRRDTALRVFEGRVPGHDDQGDPPSGGGPGPSRVRATASCCSRTSVRSTPVGSASSRSRRPPNGAPASLDSSWHSAASRCCSRESLLPPGRGRSAAPAPGPAGRRDVSRHRDLLVEDADPLRVMIREILEGAGYTVLACPDPEEALRQVGILNAPVHLMLTDVVMPRLSGPDLARSVQIARPEIKVLFMSGHTPTRPWAFMGYSARALSSSRSRLRRTPSSARCARLSTSLDTPL
jgi:CheY-like chemotaxis protein